MRYGIPHTIPSSGPPTIPIPKQDLLRYQYHTNINRYSGRILGITKVVGEWKKRVQDVLKTSQVQYIGLTKLSTGPKCLEEVSKDKREGVNFQKFPPRFKSN